MSQTLKENQQGIGKKTTLSEAFTTMNKAGG